MLVLPHPDGPTSAANWPFSICRPYLAHANTGGWSHLQSD